MTEQIDEHHDDRRQQCGSAALFNGIESFWSLTKRRLTEFYGVKINFDIYLKESEWHWRKILII